MASKIRHLFSRNAGHATRPIQREPRGQEWIAESTALAQHNAFTAARQGPTVSPGLLVTQPSIAGTKVRGGIHGAYFAPPSNRKFR